ncbi:MAG: tetratricopeptide repeat protein [Candidatus Bruticola sp.]
MAADASENKKSSLGDCWRGSKLYNHYTYTSPEEQIGADEQSNLLQAMAMYVEGCFEQAEHFYVLAAQEDSEEVKVRGRRGSIHCRLAGGNLDQAIKDGESFMNDFPELVEAKSTWLYALSHKLKKKDLDKLKDIVLQVYGSAGEIVQKADDPILALERIFILYKANMLNEAAEAVSDWKQRFSNDLNLCQCMGEMFYALHRCDKAFNFLQIAAKRGVNRARLWYLHALSAAANKNFDLAECSVEKAARLHSTLPFMEGLAEEVQRLKKQAKGSFLDFIKNVFLP